MSDLPHPVPEADDDAAPRFPLTLASPGATQVVPDPDADDSAVWDRLIAAMDAGTVVPIIGGELITINSDGRTKRLYSVLAEQLARALPRVSPQTAADSASPLNAVAAEFILNGGEPDDIYSRLNSLARDLGDLPPPAPLCRLAKIDRFPLFVTTTFDGMLARAVSEARGLPVRAAPQRSTSAAPGVRVEAFSSRSRPLTSDALDFAAGPLVYHLFGRLSSLQDYVVTEEDALEFVFLLQSARHQPAELLEYLKDKSLLVLGCSFPSWFVRFFLRLTRGRRLLSSPRELIAFVVDRGATQDAGLLQFLKAFRTRTEFFTRYDAPEFVEKLCDLWDRHVGAGNVAPPMEGGAVFISYASEDLPHAEAVARGLMDRGVPVWFDRADFEPGDRWRAKISVNIETASAFVPILSETTARSTLREFFYEWNQARERVKLLAPDDKFIFPVLIEGQRVNPSDPAIPSEFRSVHWANLVAGQVPESLVEALKASIRRKKAGARR